MLPSPTVLCDLPTLLGTEEGRYDVAIQERTLGLAIGGSVTECHIQPPIVHHSHVITLSRLSLNTIRMERLIAN